MSDLLQHFTAQQNVMVNLLTELVNHESFTQDKEQVDSLGDFMEGQFNALGAEVIERHPQTEVGDIVLAKWNPNAPGKPILFLVHIDTVWPTGTLAERPVRIEADGRLYGPGAIDMKGGITIALTALRGLRETGQFPQRPIYLLMTTDEEVGSKYSEDIIKETAQDCGLVLVMEPATKEGALKTWRKGIATYTLSIKGRPSHAGNAPEQGVNSVIEFAQQALAINQLNDLKNGTSVSVTMVNGGSAGNVIPERTEAYIDTRTTTVQTFNELDESLHKLHPFIPGAVVNIRKNHYRPPMERRGEVFEQARAIGERYGLTVREDGSGGGSDGNFTAAMGIPTLDGLGPQGDGLHALHEHVVISSLPQRAALIAGILKDWQME